MKLETAISKAKQAIQTNDGSKARWVFEVMDVLQGADRQGLVDYLRVNKARLTKRQQEVI